MDNFASSDDSRTTEPLRHAQYYSLDGPVPLELGASLSRVTVCYETYGTLNGTRTNAILICHALSGDSHVAQHDPDDSAGWWDLAVGPGCAIDTDRFFVICANLLGGCRGTTGPSSTDPGTGQPYGRAFPDITIRDMVNVQCKLIDHLGIDRLLAVAGGSMGGQQALEWAVRFPQRVCSTILLATSPRLTSQSLAFDIVGRNAIMHDPGFHDGQYYNETSGPDDGLAIARMIGHITYLSQKSMRVKFDADRYTPKHIDTTFEKAFSVGSYLGHQGMKFVERFDANSYVTLTRAMDLFDMGSTHEELTAALACTQCRWVVVSFSSDWLFPPEQSRQIVDALVACGKSVTYCNVETDCGHDAFLLPQDLDLYGELIRAHLSTTSACRCCSLTDCLGVHTGGRGDAGPSVLSSNRIDYDRVVGLIPENASVLDLGCGQGGLLCKLKLRGHTQLAGIELDQTAVLDCVRNGQDVIQADLNTRLPKYLDKQFDVVVLSRTLQTVINVEGVLAEMLRIGRLGIVTFPNFAYHRLRAMMCEQGRAPEAPGVLSHRWYNTANLRFFSIADFETLCAEKGITIHQTLALDTEAGCDITENQNLNADLAIFVLSLDSK